MKDYFRQISRSGQSAALLLRYYPDCPFATRRLIQVLGITGLSAISSLLTLIATMLGASILSLLILVVLIFLVAGIINVVKEKDIACFLFPPITMALIIFFSIHYLSWLRVVNTQKTKEYKISSYIQI